MSEDMKIRLAVAVLLGITISFTLLMKYSDAELSSTSAAARTAAGPNNTPPPEITVGHAARKRQLGAFLLDVRKTVEWEEYHIPGSFLIPLNELTKRLDEVPRDREVVLVCRTGQRSLQGRDILIKAGFRKVANMRGGLLQWRADGYPTVDGK